MSSQQEQSTQPQELHRMYIAYLFTVDLLCALSADPSSAPFAGRRPILGRRPDLPKLLIGEDPRDPGATGSGSAKAAYVYHNLTNLLIRAARNRPALSIGGHPPRRDGLPSAPRLTDLFFCASIELSFVRRHSPYTYGSSSHCEASTLSNDAYTSSVFPGKYAFEPRHWSRASESDTCNTSLTFYIIRAVF